MRPKDKVQNQNSKSLLHEKYSVNETVRCAQPCACQAEEGEESEEEGLPEDPDNYNVEAQALFEPEVEAEAGPAEESFQRHFASAVGIQARYVKNMHSISVLVFASFPINPLPFQEPAPEDAAMEAAVTVTGLPRLRAKQRPHTGWEAVPIKASVLKMFEDLKKQPVKQTRKCQGNGDRPCVFGKKGKALFTSRGYRQCIWCSPSRLLEACRSGKASRGGLAKSFEAMTEHQQARAEALLPDEFKGYFVELRSKQKRCQGRDGERCVFAESNEGGQAQVHRKKKKLCLFCDIEALALQCRTPTGRSNVLQRLRRMAATSREKAVRERVPEEHQAYFEKALTADGNNKPGAKRASRKRPASAGQTNWKAVLEQRQNLSGTRHNHEVKSYRKQVLDDRARVRRRFGLPGRAARGAQVNNETGLPLPKRRKLGQQLHEWCRSGSWGMCRQCHSMVPLDLTESALQRQKAPTVPPGQCSRCRAKTVCAAPVPEEVPEPLRNLSKQTVEALSPLEIDVGPEIRAAHNSGYRQHATMIRFRWKTQTVKNNIADKEERAKARAAHRFLLAKEDCSYSNKLADHQQFLAKHPKADDRKRRRRLQFIETPGLETALWPHLFYTDAMCLTQVRLTDIRRTGRARGPTLEAATRKRPADASEDDEEEDEKDDASSGEEGQQAMEGEDDADGQRHSTKRAYAALALCARIGFGSSYELLHFAYDLNLWTALGAKKKTSREYDVPMRVLMKGHSFSPLYWKSIHWALLDMVRQLGYPKIFWTISPYEWSMPYHQWLLDEMAKEMRGRLHLAVAESLHVTHVLIEVVRGLLAGVTGNKSKDPWRSHLLRAANEDGEAA